MSPHHRLVRCFAAEGRGALLVAAVVLPLVVISNATASLALILLHAGVLIGLVPAFICLLTVWMKPFRAPSDDALPLPLDIAVHIIGVIGASLVMIPMVAFISNLPIPMIASKPLVAGLIPVCMAYVIWRVTLFYKRARIRAATLEAERARHALAALSAQVKPHFLFNALSSIEQLIQRDADRAAHALSHLSSLYRHVLAASDETFFSMADELALANHYLEIQAMRFGERLNTHIDVDNDVRDAAVPATLLLTLVENAVKHGIETRLEGGTVHIAVRRANGGLGISVANPAPHRPTELPTSGHGLNDVRKRLHLLYGDAADFELSTVNEMVHATVFVPDTHRDIPKRLKQ